ncbi:laccase [Lyophyllum atratum]|nr:laccase [Lyophyllum atratum]
MFSAGRIIALCTISLSVTANAASIGPVSDLVISNKVISPDGFSRSAVLAGGTFPGPLIKASKGAHYKLNVINRLTDSNMLRSTSIHWHGIFQRGTNWADGTAFVTQCPITPGDSFLYQFSVPSQVGTYWYHSHLSTQYCDGLRGPLVIYDPDDPFKSMYDVDNENTVITLADWYHDYAPAANGGLPLMSQATLINGKGRAVNGTAAPLSVINVEKNKRYRFRIIAMSCDSSFEFHIDNHTFTVIEADGEYTRPLVVDALQIYAGQRYSVIMTANQPVGNYWVRANPDIRSVPGFDGGRNSAILRYAGAPATDPTTNYRVANLLKEVDLHALYSPKAPGKPWKGGADVNLNIVHTFNATSFHYEMNGAPFIPPTVPVLLQILSGTQDARDLLPKGSVHSLPPNKVIELSLPGTGVELGGPHPFHLHGHSFSVVRSGGSSEYNYLDPVRRDTVNTGLADGNATIRFVTDNAGPWFLHWYAISHLYVLSTLLMAHA